MRKLLACLALAVVLLPLAAQIDLPRPNLNPFRTSGNALLPTDKIQMSHSMGFEAGTSSVGDGYYLSRYTNHIKYKLNPKLELDLDLNFVNYGSVNTSSKFSMNDDNSNRLIPEFSLRYKPSDSVLIQVQMNHGAFASRARNAWYDLP